MHALGPVDDLYEPIVHAVHPAEFAVVTVPVWPAAQILQDVAATLPVVEVEYSAAQDVHAPLPEAALYEPAAQMVHPLGVDPVTSAVPP